MLLLQLAVARGKRLDRNRWTVLATELAVALGPNTIRYPDVMVDVASGGLKDLTATAPMLIAEVLSSSSIKDELQTKAAEYMQLPSLSAYLVLAQDEPKAWIWLRSDNGFPNEPVVVSGGEATIEIPAHSIDLPLSEICAGLY
jgi:Uma2 family endonuclease